MEYVYLHVLKEYAGHFVPSEVFLFKSQDPSDLVSFLYFSLYLLLDISLQLC